MIRVLQATTDDQIQAATDLSAEYIRWIVTAVRETYPELNIEQFIGGHDYDAAGAEIFSGNVCRPPVAYWLP